MERGDRVAQVLVLFLFVVAFNAYRRGELRDWTMAKLFNAGSPAPAGTVTAADIMTVTGQGLAVGAIDAATGTTGPVEGGTDLVTVGSTRMSKRFAARWLPLMALAATKGITLTGGAYRSGAAQIELRKKNCGTSHYAIYQMPSGQCSPPTATPGRSNHETGDAIDVKLSGAGGRQSPEFKFLAQHGPARGVHNLPSEPWHWSIDGN